MVSAEILGLQAGELPEPLNGDVVQRWQSVLERCDTSELNAARQWYCDFAASSRRIELLRAFACSPAASTTCASQTRCG